MLAHALTVTATLNYAYLPLLPGCASLPWGGWGSLTFGASLMQPAAYNYRVLAFNPLASYLPLGPGGGKVPDHIAQ